MRTLPVQKMNYVQGTTSQPHWNQDKQMYGLKCIKIIDCKMISRPLLITRIDTAKKKYGFGLSENEPRDLKKHVQTALSATNGS